ncbi:MAG: DUF4412 domain-containing protein [Ignavibacteriaceae bacterium]
MLNFSSMMNNIENIPGKLLMCKVKIISIMILTGLLCFPASNLSQGKFEGKITIKVPEIENYGELSYYIKGDKIRINVEGKQRNSDLIIDPDKKEMILLKTQMSKYIIFPFDNYVETGMVNKNEILKQFKNTGSKKNIQGHDCEKWIYQTNNKEIIVWLTKDIGQFRFFRNPDKNHTPIVWKNDIENSGYFPLKIEEKSNSGKAITTLEVKDIKRMKLENDYFQPPGDFEEMKKPNINLMKNFMQKNL